MKNQALITAISGLLIGGFGIANKIDILKISGSGLLFSSVILTLIEDQKSTKLDDTPEPPSTSKPKPKPKPKNPQPSTDTEAKKILPPIKRKKPQSSGKTENLVLLPKPIHPKEKVPQIR